MSCGFDAGTYNIITCKRNATGDLVYKREVNAFLEMPLENEFVFNMMKKAGVPLILREDAKIAYALGEAAVNIAYTMSQISLRRPMHDGCVNPKEKDAFQIMSIMMHSLLDNIDHDKEIMYYSVPANAVNQETDVDYHRKILDAIFKAYKSDQGYTVDARPINEGMAVVYSELGKKYWTGTGVSCLCPGVKIYTNRGILKIEDVKPGDEVITHTGQWSPIQKVITKEFSGIATKIQVNGYSEEYKFVDNHELYVKRDGSWKWIGCEEIVVGDIIGEPIIRRDRDVSRPALNLCERTTCSKKWNKKSIESTPDVQRFMGYFLGDGSVNLQEGCIQIDFGVHEQDFVQDAKEILEKRFGKNSTETLKSEAVTRLKCYSKGLANWMHNHCYADDGSKTYPWSIDRLSNSECLNLLTGLIRSDGSVEEEKVIFFNTSTRLVMLVKQLFSRIGIASVIDCREPRVRYYEKEDRYISGKKQAWSVSASGKRVKYSLIEQINGLNCSNSMISEKVFIEDGFCCGTVHQIDHEEYEGTVYDLQIPGDHSFSGPFMTIHNCGAGMINVAFSLFGVEVFSFSLVNSGDWIDKQAAKATGESIAFINKEKHKIDLTKPPTTLVERAIRTQYELMIERTVAGIKKGLIENEEKIRRLDNPIDVVVAGGTASPPGFDVLFKELLLNAQIPVNFGEIIRPDDPLYCVSRGCLIAAENATK